MVAHPQTVGLVLTVHEVGLHRLTEITETKVVDHPPLTIDLFDETGKAEVVGAAAEVATLVVVAKTA